jgi:hypothetical protein
MALWFCLSGFGQIRQDHPELCGDGTRYFPIPQNVSAVREPWISTGALALVWEVDGITKRVDLNNTYEEIQEVCQVLKNRLVLFGFNDVGYDIAIIDLEEGRKVDSFWAYDPLTSPDQHWLILRAFQSPRGEVRISEAYLLYDLKAYLETNAPQPNPGLQIIPERARLLYPVLPGKNLSAALSDIPESDNHFFRSESFYWSSDSQSVVFADSARDTLSVVLATIADGKISAYVHPVSAAEACTESTASVGTSSLTLSHAEVNSIPATPLQVTVDFKSAAPGCTPRQLRLTQADFQPAKTEVYRPIPRKKPVGIDARQKNKQ